MENKITLFICAICLILQSYINYRQNKRLDAHKEKIIELVNNHNKVIDYLNVKEYERNRKNNN